MDLNKFGIGVVGHLEKMKTERQVKSDIKSLKEINIPLVGKLLKTRTKAQLKKDIESVTATVNLTAKANEKGVSSSVKNIVKQAQEIANKNNIKLNIGGIDNNKLDDIIAKLKQLSQSSSTLDTTESVNAINREAHAMLEIIDNARKAALEKREFAEANREVRESADNTVDAIVRERNAMGSLDNINYILDNVNLNAQQGDSVFRRFGNTLNEAFATYTIANLLEDVIYEIIDAGREGIEVVKELNDVATSLRMATGGSLEETNALVDSYNDLGQELGAITRDVSESADAWLRQGHSIADTNTLITDSMMLSKIANLESAESTQFLTSIMQAYRLSAEEVVDIVSKLSAVDLESASDAGGLAKSMSRCASAAKMAGVSMDTLIGYIATVKEVTQDSDEAVGNMFKSVFSRMNQIRAGKFVDLETGESLNDTEKVLNKIGIVTRDVNNQLIDSEQILDSIGKSWETYDSNTQKALATAVAGTYQYNKFIALMQSYADAMNYANISAGSKGVAEEKFGYYLDSLEAKTNSLQASLENLATTTLSDELYGSVLDTSKAVVDLIADTGVLKGLLVGLGTSGALYGFQQITHALGDITQGFANLNEVMNMTRSGTVGINDMQRLIDLTGGLSQSQTRLLLSTNNLTDAQKIAILMNQGLTQAEAQQTIQTWGVATAQNGATGATITLTGALRGLWATLMANPLVLVTGLVTAGTMALQAYNQKLEETRQKAKEAAEESASYVEELLDLKKQLEEGTSSAEDLTSAFREQMRTMGYTEEEIDNLIDKYNGLAGAINEATKEALENAKTDAYTDKALSAKELENVVSSSRFTSGISQISINDWGWTGNNDLDSQIEEILSEISKKNGKTDVWNLQDKSAEGIYEYYLGLQEILQLIQETARETGDESLLDLGSFVNPTLYGKVTEYVDKLSESATAYGDAINRLHNADARLELSDYLKTNDIDSKEAFDTYIEGIKNSTEYSEAYKSVLISVANDAFPKFSVAIQNAVASTEEFTKIAEHLSFTESISQIETLSDGLDQLADIYNDIKDSGDFDYSSILNNDKFKNAFSDYREEYDNFIKTVTNSPNDIEACQEAFDKLASAYVNNCEELKNVNEESKSAVIQFLKQKGITNAQALVEAQLEAQRLKGKVALDNMTDATYASIKALLEEEDVSNLTKQALFGLISAEKIFKSTTLSSNDKLKELEKLAIAFGIVSDAADKANHSIAIEERINELRKSGAFSESHLNTLREQMSAHAYNVAENEYKAKFGALMGDYSPTDNSSSNSKSSSETIFDHVQTKVEKTTSALDGLSDTINDTYSSWETRSNQLTTAITETEKAIGLMGEAYNAYIAEANKSGLSESDKKLFQIGAIDIDKLSSDDPLKEQFENYKEWYEKALDVQEKKKKLEEDLQDLKTNGNLELVKARTDADIEEYNAQIHRLDTLLDARSINGKFAQASAYEEMKSYNGKKISAYKEQESALMNAMKYVDKNSEAYYALNMQLTDVRNSILELENKTIEYNNEIRNLNWDAFEYLEESISRVADKAKHFKELLSLEELFDDKGNATKYADATLGLHITVLETYKKQADDYLSQIQDLEKQLENGGGKDVLEQYQNMLDVHQNMISAIANERQEIIALTEKGYKTQLEYLGKIADKRKENLRAEKDFRSYERSINEKVADKNSLLKQYEAYKNDTSEQGKMMAQKLKLEIEKKEQDISDMEYDKMISETESMLNKVSSDYETFITEKLTDSDSLLHSIIDEVSSKGKEINKTLTEIANKYGTTVGESISISVQGNTEGAINNLVRDIMSIAGIEKIGGYANGTLSATKGLHRFNEKGNEIIIRKSDGSMLRNFDQGDVVISNEGAKLLSKFAENPALFMEKFGMSSITPVMPNVSLPKMPVMQGRQAPIQNVTVDLGGITMNGVNDPEELTRQIRHTLATDSRTEKILDVKIAGRMLGKQDTSRFYV